MTTHLSCLHCPGQARCSSLLLSCYRICSDPVCHLATFLSSLTQLPVAAGRDLACLLVHLISAPGTLLPTMWLPSEPMNKWGHGKGKKEMRFFKSILVWTN